MDLAHLVSEEQRSLEVLLGKMAAIILPFTHAQYCTFFITKEGSTVKLAVHCHTLPCNRAEDMQTKAC